MTSPDFQQAQEWPTLTGVTGVLQAVTFAANKSPLVVLVERPAGHAVEVVARWLRRYPELLATPQEQTALRKFGHPAPSLIIGSSGHEVTLFLMVNVLPQEPRFQREQFVDLRVTHLGWRHYLLGRHIQQDRWSWWLDEAKVAAYRQTITATVLSLKYGHAEGRARRLEALFAHLNTYPMGRGVREQVFGLQGYARQQWRVHRQGRAAEARDLVLPSIPVGRRVKQRSVALQDFLHDGGRGLSGDRVRCDNQAYEAQRSRVLR